MQSDIVFQQSSQADQADDEECSTENIISCLQRDLSDEIQQAKERKENCTDALEKASANGALGALLLVEAHLNKLINGKEKKQNDKR